MNLNLLLLLIINLMMIKKNLPFKMTDYLSALPSEILWNILLQSPYPDLLNLCQANTELNEICRNNYFWRLKIIRDFQITIEFINHINSWNNSYSQLYEKLYSIENSLTFKSSDDTQYSYLMYMNPDSRSWNEIYHKWLLVQNYPLNTIIDEKRGIQHIAPLTFVHVNNNFYRRLETALQYNHPINLEYVYWPDYNIFGDINDIYNTFKSLGYRFVGPQSGRLYFLSKGLLGRPHQYYPELTIEYIRNNSINPLKMDHREFIKRLNVEVSAIINRLVPDMNEWNNLTMREKDQIRNRAEKEWFEKLYD